MKYRVIVNPLAGRGFGARCLPKLRRLLSEHGLDYDLVCTSWAGEAIDLARQAVLDGYETVVAVGGDGTYHEVINGMMAAPRSGRAPDGGVVGNLGVIPVGSACDFAWMVGIPSDLEGACARLAQHQTKVIDLGKVTVDAAQDVSQGNQRLHGVPYPHGDRQRTPTQGLTSTRYFDNTVGIGFDGIVTIECRKIKHLRGMALYLPVVLKTVFLSLKPPRSVIEYEAEPTRTSRTVVYPTDETNEADDIEEADAVRSQGSPDPSTGKLRRLQKTILMATICNGRREGGGFFIAPQAENDDGLLDVCLADNLPRLQILGMVPHFMKGTHVDKSSVTMIRSKRVVITSPDPLIAHADGEILCTDAHRIECEILPRQLRVVC